MDIVGKVGPPYAAALLTFFGTNITLPSGMPPDVLMV